MPTRKKLVSTAWDRIEAWLKTHDTAKKLPLPPGVSAKEIARAEAAIGFQLPDDMRESYSRHNGQHGLWIFEQGYLMALTAESAIELKQYNIVGRWSKMLDYAKAMKGEPGGEPVGPIKKDWWNRNWIPVLDSECGDNICLDMSPEPGGRFGQVIDWWHEKGATVVLAESFSAFLLMHAEKLESGKCRINGVGQVVDVNEPG